MTSTQHAAIARELEATGEFRVLRRIHPRATFNEPDGTPTKIGVIVDVETTGTDPERDEIIELGMVAFEFAPDGRVFKVLEEFGQLCQPTTPIPPEITRITGISDAMVAGSTIDAADVADFIDPVAVVIAHNAGFDRRFCERAWEVFSRKAWACSATEVDWAAEGFQGTKLAYLVNQIGLFHTGHRATEDCRALLEVLSRTLPLSGEPALKRLLDTARFPTIRIRAENSPFETKDALKARAYRWNDGSNGGPRCWWRDVAESQLAAEILFLRREIYGRDVEIPTQRLTAFDRFSNRTR